MNTPELVQFDTIATFRPLPARFFQAIVATDVLLPFS